MLLYSPFAPFLGTQLSLRCMKTTGDESGAQSENSTCIIQTLSRQDGRRRLRATNRQPEVVVLVFGALHIKQLQHDIFTEG